MKTFLLVAFVISLSLIPASGQDCSKAPALINHVYHPTRLVEKKGCITVTGVMVKKLKEKDGDFHVRLKLDAGQGGGLIKSKNTQVHGGNLVFEPICVLPVTQKTAKKACRHWKQKISLPNKGDRIEVTGIHMLDTEHGWLEIHPVTKIVLLPPY